MRIDQRFDPALQLDEIALLVDDDFRPADRSVARAYLFRAELLHRLQCLDPFPDVAIGEIIVRPIHARVTGEENFLLREPDKAIALGVRDAEPRQLDPPFAIIEEKFARK